MSRKIQELEEQLEARTMELELSNAEIMRYKNEISSLTKKTDEMNEQIKEFRSKEQAISWALTEAKAAERRILSDAEKRISAMEGEAKTKADAIINEARSEAHRTVQKAEASVLEYEQNIKRLNGQLARAASEAREQSERFAQLIAQIKPEVDLEYVEEMKGYGEFAESRKADMPEDYETPSELMQNIYKLQGRDISSEVPFSSTEDDSEDKYTDQNPAETEKIWRVDDFKESKTDIEASDVLNDELNSIIDEVLRED